MTVKKQAENDPEAVEADNHGNAQEGQHDDGIGPTGRWKNGMFDCIQRCTPLCILGICCDCVVLAQVMTRLGLNRCGTPDPAGSASTFAMVILVICCYWAGVLMVFGIVFTPCFLVYMILIFTKTRYEFRQRFQIEPDYCQCCDGLAEDCLCSNFCRCCVSIQMARHTHDENRYPYKYDAPTGLPDDAPPLVEGLVSYQEE